MKSLQPCFSIVLFLIFSFLIPQIGLSQNRIKPPKRESKIKSADQFVDNSFSLYHKVYVYDSLSKANVEIPSELEDELLKSAQTDIDSLWQVLPTVFEDMSSGNASILKKGKATINLNKSKKALSFCVKTVKLYFTEDEKQK